MAAKGFKDVNLDPSWAWARYEPGEARPWTLALAGHLFRRAAFGANWDQLQRALRAGPHETIDGLLRPGEAAVAFNRTYDAYETAEAGGQSVAGLRAWWLRRMILSPFPLLERMTLFWHGHFGIGNRRVQNAGLMLGHLRSLRAEALGSFGTMLRAIPYDPAVLLCLGGIANRKSAPDQRFARALLHNYTLGPGLFREEDVAEASRAFTGWFVLRGKLKYIAREHDEGPKRILGRRGNFAADDVVALVLDHPGTSKRIVRALYRELISETQAPDDELIAPLAESFAVDYDLSKLTETMLRSNLFFSPVAYRQRVKSPVDFAVGIARAWRRRSPRYPLPGQWRIWGSLFTSPPPWKASRAGGIGSTTPRSLEDTTWRPRCCGVRGPMERSSIPGRSPGGTNAPPSMPPRGS